MEDDEKKTGETGGSDAIAYQCPAPSRQLSILAFINFDGVFISIFIGKQTILRGHQRTRRHLLRTHTAGTVPLPCLMLEMRVGRQWAAREDKPKHSDVR